eukprot:scaffold4800_cov327-Prasinococcus_capsulatus_cf.AAC.5
MGRDPTRSGLGESPATHRKGPQPHAVLKLHGLAVNDLVVFRQSREELLKEVRIICLRKYEVRGDSHITTSSTPRTSQQWRFRRGLGWVQLSQLLDCRFHALTQPSSLSREVESPRHEGHTSWRSRLPSRFSRAPSSCVTPPNARTDATWRGACAPSPSPWAAAHDVEGVRRRQHGGRADAALRGRRAPAALASQLWRRGAAPDGRAVAHSMVVGRGGVGTGQRRLFTTPPPSAPRLYLHARPRRRGEPPRATRATWRAETGRDETR